MSERRPHTARFLLPLAGVLLLACFGSTVQAHVDVIMDAETIGELLAALTPENLQVPIPGGQRLNVKISDLKVAGFDPAAGNGQGHVLTSLTLNVPDLGLTVPVEPRVALEVVEQDGLQVCQLRFKEVKLDLSVLGSVDISRLLPAIRVPADHVAVARGARGDVHVRSKLVDVQMGTRALRLRFDVSVVEIEPPPAPSQN